MGLRPYETEQVLTMPISETTTARDTSSARLHLDTDSGDSVTHDTSADLFSYPADLNAR